MKEKTDASIEVIHEGKVRKARNGAQFRKVICIVFINGIEFIKEFYLFEV